MSAWHALDETFWSSVCFCFFLDKELFCSLLSLLSSGFCLLLFSLWILSSICCLLHYVIRFESRVFALIFSFCFRLRCSYICLLSSSFSYVSCLLYFAISFRCNHFCDYYFLIFIFLIMSSGFCLMFSVF